MMVGTGYSDGSLEEPVISQTSKFKYLADFRHTRLELVTEAAPLTTCDHSPGVEIAC